MSASETYVVVKAKGGMGNRMLCAASGILYGLLTGRRIFVDWADGVYGDYGENVFHRYFHAPDVLSEIPKAFATVYPPVWINSLDKTVAQLMAKLDPNSHSSKFIHRKYSIDVRRLDYPEACVVFWNYSDRVNMMRRHIGRLTELAGKERGAILRWLLTEMFPIGPTILGEVVAFKKAHWQQHVIGVHVRYSDHKSSLSRCRSELGRFLDKYPQAAIFLATDNALVEESFRTDYPNIICTSKWMPESGSALHFSKNNPDRFRSGVEALIDMQLLSECQSLVFPGRSTFSWISSVLGAPKGQYAVDIDRWEPKAILSRWLREIIP